jgi:predicted permease
MPPFDPRSWRHRLYRGWDVARARGRALLRSRNREEAQLRADLQFHVEQMAAERRRTGTSEEVARSSALRTFGSPARVIEEVREMSPWTALERITQDLRYGARGLLHAPAFTATVVLSLGLAIGANTAIFGVVDAFVFRAVQAHEPEHLFTLRLQGAAGASPGRAYELSYRQFAALCDRLPQFASVAGRGGRLDRYNITASGPGGGLDPQQTWIEPVSGTYFSTLGLHASQGRLFTPDEDRAAGASPVAVISDAYWRRRFASAPDVVGRTLSWNNATFVIVGVAPQRFTGLTTALVTDIWVPLTTAPMAIPEAPNLLTDERARWVQLVARLKPDMTVDQGAAVTNIAWRHLRFDHPSPVRGAVGTPSDAPQLELASLAHGFQGPRSRFAQPLTVVLAVMLLVLLIACVTVANLVLARSVARAREFAVRQALGASRGRLMRQILIECGLLGCGAAGVGLVLGLWAGAAAPRLLDVDLVSGAAQLDVRFDGRLLAFTAALCLLTTMLVGFAPVLKGARVSLTSALTGARATSQGGGGVRARRGLVVVQVALSLVLLAGSGLFVRTLQNLASIETGAESRDTLIVWTRPGQTALESQGQKALYDQAAAALSSMPGVHTASFSYGALFPIEPTGSAVEPIDGRSLSTIPVPSALWRYAAPGMLEAVGIPLIAGRDFSGRDDATSPRVAIVNGVLARQFFGNDDPIGRHFRFSSGGQPIEIIGVMRDTTFESPRERARPSFYLPHRQATGSPGGLVWLAVRPTGTQGDLPAQIRRTLHDLSPHLAVLSIERAEDVLDRTHGQERLLAIVSGSFAAVATVLTCVGLYGIVAFTTARRTREIGLRLALGAHRGGVIVLVLKESLVLVLLGATIGLPAAVAATSLLRNRLFDVTPADPIALVSAAGLMMALALVAGYLPARRASMTLPTVALRSE